MKRFKISKDGYSKLKDKLDHLINVERPEVSKAIGLAIELGDLSENAEYSAAKDRQGIIEGMIADLNEKLAGAEVVDISTLTGSVIDFGATVTIFDEDTEREVKYQLLSEFEAELEKNQISVESPVGRALLGKKEGDYVEINAPSGAKHYEVIKIEWR